MNILRRLSAAAAAAALIGAGGGFARAAAEASAPAAAPTAGAATAAASADKTYQQLKVLIDILDYIQQNYVDPVDTKKLIRGAEAGMVRTLDPFSQYMDPEQNREIETETEGDFGGLGIRVGEQDDWLTIITPLPGTPAYRAGILPGDRLVGVNDQTTKDMTLDDALKLLRGAPGTKVKLTILRGPDDGGDGPWTSHDFTLAREIIKIDSVDSWMLQDGIGYVRIIEFSKNTAQDLLAALNNLKKQGMTSVIIDLRNNPGGLLAAAVDVGSLFLGDNQLIVYTQGRKPDSRQEFRAAKTAPYPDLPMVILINGGSASASEIVSGCMQDHKRAVIMGERSFGKGTVQSVIPLPDGSGLRLTVARYYTPSGRSIHRDEKTHKGGILPDIVVPVPSDVEAKLYNQWDMIYAQGKKPHSVVRKEDMVPDDTLERAEELLKARDLLGVFQKKP